MTIALRIEPEEVTVDPGMQGVFTIHVVNQSGVVDRVGLDILGTAGAWAVVDPPAVALFPGTDATATVVITPPLGTPLGPVPLGVRATAETSGFVEVGEGNLNVGASRTVEAELRPRTATGKRRATSVIVLRNLGNAPTKVSVVATDPDDAIVFDAPSALSIGPGQEAELPLRMRLPSREKQGATLPYQVLVEGGDTGQSLDGQVRQPAKKRWPVLVLLALVGLLAAAVLMLGKREDSVAITGAPGGETTTTALGATTVVATTVAAAAPVDPAAAAAAAPVPGAPAPGAAATTTPTTLPPAGAPQIVNPIQATPVPCAGALPKGSPQQTAQRVVCAWEASARALDDEVNVAKTITQAAREKLGPQTESFGTDGDQVAGTPTASGGVVRVPFQCRTNNSRGVRAMILTGGIVTDVEKCALGISR